MEQIFQNVIINRQEINSIEFENESIEIPLYPGGEQTFEILVTNYGSPTHIHLSVSEELKGQITFLRDNPYVLQKEYVSAVARIPQEGRVLTKGHIYITAGYGSKKKGFPVHLGKAGTEAKPQEPSKDEATKREEDTEELKPSRPSVVEPVIKISRPRTGGGSRSGFSGISSPFRRNFKGGFSPTSGKKTRKGMGQNERLPLALAFGGFLLLVFLFFLYFILPAGLQFSVSFAQALLFSILFVTCTTYILLKIMEDG
ncbi:hypothetical protein EO98_00885 [Methanosarcina sp. 2.H.T.1A.6]|uniref:DUF7524 family protein n=1 Tax=unclassified Methanosarcina TaxID=2644672 RepID=UPI000620F9ED|nr:MULTISPECIES: hypothetical protein [unclassified Methanosarcina]KKG13885.1 hypothetical protein EO94_19350 [Methanosarcina sp. 2.H.T.1A.3]KKG17827.1 hypothetical protein EO97_20535 [Methanosarcina sp. 2.H.T.1A.15]KKG21663.1 hypothetical protein EO96_03805 [Methanosarcina sp. 2.H.T.1A.8]KKG25076.1 hypothetical protein EO98_00885 [Methanosarcina sp. 2.H.T.1A.6]